MPAPPGSLLATRRGKLLLLGGRAGDLLAAAVIGMRAANSRGEPVIHPADTHAAREQVPAPELAD